MTHAKVGRAGVVFQMPTPTAGMQSTVLRGAINEESLMALAKHSRSTVEIIEIRDEALLPDGKESISVKAEYKKGMKLKPLDYYDRE